MTKILRIDELYEVCEQNGLKEDPDLIHLDTTIRAVGNMIARKVETLLGVKVGEVTWDHAEMGGWAAPVYAPSDLVLKERAIELLNEYDNGEPLEDWTEQEGGATSVDEPE